MTAIRIPDFDLWREGYGGATVTVYVANTTTLASLWANPQATTPLSNPIVLDERIIDSQSFGKFPQPVYCADAYYLKISNGDQTGMQSPPIVDMTGVDVSAAVASTLDGDAQRTIAEWLGRDIDVRAYGSFLTTDGSAVCTETLNAAIGVAAARGGSPVYLPAGTFTLNPFTLPEGVWLCGAGMAATKLLCSEATTFVTIGGDGAGFEELTLDGINTIASSIGVDGLNIDQVRFNNVTIERFATGLRLRGGEAHNWRNLFLSSNTTAGLLAGDLDASGTNTGAAFGNMRWTGGAIAFNGTEGLILKAVDALCHNIHIADVETIGNIGTAFHLIGVRDATIAGHWASSNVIDIKIEDNTVTPLPAVNTTSRITVAGGRIDGAAISSKVQFIGSCDLVTFRDVDFANVDIDLTSPSAPIYLIDCKTDAQTTVQGLTQFLLRQTTDHGGQIVGVTSGASSAVAWYGLVPPGDSWIMEAKVVGRRTNGTARGSWWITATVDRPAATLNYSSLVTAFTVGSVVTGTTSGASARIVANSGTALTLIDITGTFQNAEVITDLAGGEARVSGTLNTTNAALSGSGVQSLKTADDGFSGATVLFSASGGNAQLVVTGVASNDIEWACEVEVFKS